MTTMIAATNRAESNTIKVAKEVSLLLTNTSKKEIKLLDLAKVDFDKLNTLSYQSNSPYANSVGEEYLIPAQKLIFKIPEYNGSFPGILKYFIDLISTTDFKKTFSNKTAILIGVAQGQAGNLRGLTQLDAILMHMGVNVVPKSLPININNQFDEEGKLIASTKKRIQNIIKITLLVLFVTIFFSESVVAQNETELINFDYRIAQAPMENDKYHILNDVSSANSIINFSLNYGHSLKDTTYAIIYSLNYTNVSQRLDLTQVKQKDELNLLPKNYYQQPQFSQLSFSTGVSKAFDKGWSITGLFSVNIVDDFFKSELPTNINFGGSTYLERKHNSKVTYGAGIIFWQLEERVVVSPIVSFKYQNKKRGIEALLPVKIRMWQKINKVSYLEASASSNFYSIRYNSGNEVTSTDIFSFTPELTYNYLWENFIRLTIGIDMPLNDVTVVAKNETFKYIQNSLGFKFGLSLVID
jgi:chromate reductase